MTFFSLFIRHPVLAVMINLAMVVTGWFAYMSLNVEEMPNVEFPIVSVATHLQGATPSEMENQITRPVENALAVLGGIQSIESTSQQGVSIVTVKFNLGKNPDAALSDCRTAVDDIVNNFPADTKKPRLTKYSPSASAIMNVAVSGQRPLSDLTRIVKKQILDGLQAVDGVGQVKMFGGRTREIQIDLELSKLQAQQVAPATIAAAVADQNTDVPGGRVTSGYSEYQLTTSGLLSTLDAFANVIVAQRFPPQDGSTASPDPDAGRSNYATSIVKVGDLGTVVDGLADQRTLARLNGQDTVTLAISKTNDGNVVNVVRGVRRKIHELGKTLPADIRFEIVEDDSIPVKKSVAELNQHLVAGGCLACLTVLIFLGSLRLTFISAVAIPISLITTFAAMKLVGYTLNNMTLLALMLAVGLVIDDAVVILENIARLVDEKGMDPADAAVQGMQEMGFTVLATTLSLIVLFLPLSFMGGIVGQYFSSFGTTMAFCIFISMVVSFTLTPMMCARLLRKRKAEERPRESVLTRSLQVAYIAILKIALRLRFVVILLCLACLAWTLKLAAEVGKEFKGSDDIGQYNVSLQFPKGWPIRRTSEALKPVEDTLRKMRGVVYALTTIDDDDISKANIFVKLVPYEERVGYTQEASIHDARKSLAVFAGFQPSVQGTSKAYQFAVQGDDIEVLRTASARMLSELGKVPGFVDLTSDLEGAVPEVHVEIDKQKASDLGVDVKAASQALSMLVGGQKVTDFTDGNETFDVRLRLRESERDTPQAVAAAYVPSSGATPLVPLINVASVTTRLGPSELHRYNRQPVVTLSANLTSQLPLASAMRESKKAFHSLGLPAGYRVSEQGDSQMMAESAASAGVALLLAVLFMYMVLASQFENLLDPFIILLTIPLSVPFALWSLVVTHMTLNIFSVLGMFLLFGVVKKNAIMQIDHTNNLVAGGMEIRDAILEANRDRLRPILMTTLTLVVALLPLAMSGPTGAMKSPMAVVVVGGQSLCLLLTLILVPVAISYVDDFSRIREWALWKHLGRLWPHRREREPGP